MFAWWGGWPLPLWHCLGSCGLARKATQLIVFLWHFESYRTHKPDQTPILAVESRVWLYKSPWIPNVSWLKSRIQMLGQILKCFFKNSECLLGIFSKAHPGCFTKLAGGFKSSLFWTVERWWWWWSPLIFPYKYIYIYWSLFKMAGWTHEKLRISAGFCSFPSSMVSSAASVWVLASQFSNPFVLVVPTAPGRWKGGNSRGYPLVNE